MNCSILLTVSFPSLLCRAPASVPAAADVARLQERMSYADTIAQLKERQNAQEITMSEILENLKKLATGETPYQKVCQACLRPVTVGLWGGWVRLCGG
jgi:hypothetical protein